MINAPFVFPVQELLGNVETRMRILSEDHHPSLGIALKHLLSSGGKRIRVVATLLSGCMLGADREKLITLAAAIESLHTATLVHDDLIDGALIRRGIPTLNAQWSPAATVLTGDYIFARAAQLAAETESVAVMKLFAQTLSTIVNGEITQLFAGRGVANREHYHRRIYAKTASLFETATSSAAILSSASENIVQKMGKFGYEIGMAFQIIDDILDFTGEQEVVGKPVASDLRQGLITLPALNYLDIYPDDEDIKQILLGNFCDEECLSRLITHIRESGAIEHALHTARQAVERGHFLLQDLPDGPEKQALYNLAEYIISREI